MMTHELNLSPEQQTAIKQVWADQHAKMEAQRDQARQMSPEDRRAAMEAARADEKTKIEAILTPDQKTKYEAMEARMREHMRERRDGDNPPPPPPQ
jgi:periplasmic protein CpxP/Spy